MGIKPTIFAPSSSMACYLSDSCFQKLCLLSLFQVPWKLSKRFPYLVHVEETKLNRPNFNELDRLWGPNTWNWRENYTVHTWYRLWKDRSPYYYGVEPDSHSIKTWNSTFGEIARTILFGKPEIISVDGK